MSEPTIIVSHREAKRIADLLLWMSQAAETQRDELESDGHADDARELEEGMASAAHMARDLAHRIGGTL